MDDKFLQASSDQSYLFNGPYMEQYEHDRNLDALIHLFTNDVFLAYEQYNKDRDWMALADSIWKIYSNYIGFSRSIEQIGDKARMIKQFEQDIKGHFQAALNGTFADFYELPKDHAVYALTRLLGNVKSDRDFEAIRSPLTVEAKQKYDFLINRIEGEVQSQHARYNDSPEKMLSQVEQDLAECKSFKKFCLVKIEQMDPEERKRFLNTNSGDGSFYDITKKWAAEYVKICSKKTLKSPWSQLSHAKQAYKELKKN
jgi:hypothetical protein